MHSFLVDLLECPSCHASLSWNIDEKHDMRIETAVAQCVECATTYPVREGIGVFLTPELPRNDLWEQVDSRLTEYLREHPEVEHALMEAPVATLGPVDQVFRAMALEERQAYAEAKTVRDSATDRLYTAEYRTCYEREVERLVERVRTSGGPIVDLASGRCTLVEALLRRLSHPIVATDFSPAVLRRDRRWLQFWGLYDRVSLVAFDARRTPFKDGSVETLTTNLGLGNVEQPDRLLSELRRIVSGSFLAIAHFYPEDDDVNAAAIHERGIGSLLFRQTTLEAFAAAGWRVDVTDVCHAWTEPSRRGKVLEGAQVDALPVSGTSLEWCVLVAR